MMEALIWHLEGTDDPATSCQNVNRLTSGGKRQRLTPLLERVSPDAVSALDDVFDVAKRNDWVHGVVLNPNGDRYRLTRFRVHNRPFRVENTVIDLESTRCQDFYEAYQGFERATDGALGFSAIALGNDYIRSVQQP